MTSTTRKTSNTARLTALETDVAEIKTGLRALLTRFEVTPATPETAPKAAKKGKGKKAAKKALTGPAFKELQQKLRQHKAAGAIQAGVSVKVALAEGLMDAQGNLPGVSVVKVEADKPAKTPRPRKAAERAPEPEYSDRDAWIAWARPTDDGAPRRADGSVTPKAEWKVRMSLAETGAFDAAEIDRAVAGLVETAKTGR